MSIFSKISDYNKKRFDRKIERSLIRLNDKIKYNPEYNNLTIKYMTSERRSRKLSEYLVWYIGDEYLLSYFYKEGTAPLLTDSQADLRMFWRVAPDALIKVHTGIPGIISNKKSRVLWGNGIGIEVTVYTKDAEGNITDKVDEKESDKIYNMLQKVLIPKTKLMDHLKKSTEDESWSGHTALKFNFDKNITPYPIIETADARIISIIKERGHTTGIKFQEWYTNDKENKKYRLDEIYTTVRNEKELAYYNQWKYGLDTKPLEVGDAVIKYELYLLDGSQEKIVPIQFWAARCPELTGHLVTKAGEPYEAIAFNGLQGMLAMEKPNRLPNNDFPGSWYGASDYSRSALSFDKLDELYSENAREVRDNKGLQFFPPEWLDKDSEGNIIGKDKFKTNYLRSKGDMDQTQGSGEPAGAIEVKDRTDSLSKKWQIEIGMICANAHISPVSLGGISKGFEGIAASPESQQEREKDTQDTRKEMIELWTPYLNETLVKMLEFNTWLLENGLVTEQPGLDEDMDIDFENCHINVTFPDYVQQTDQEKINTWGGAKQMGVADLETVVKRIYNKLTKEQQDEIITNLRLEQGIALDNPDALNLNDLTNPEDIVPEDDKEEEEE